MVYVNICLRGLCIGESCLPRTEKGARAGAGVAGAVSCLRTSGALPGWSMLSPAEPWLQPSAVSV